MSSLPILFLLWFCCPLFHTLGFLLPSGPALGSLPRRSTNLDIPPVLHFWFCVYLSITSFTFFPFSFSHFVHIDNFLCLPLLHLFEIFPPGTFAFKAALMTTHPLPPITCIQPNGWHHATQYHHPHFSRLSFFDSWRRDRRVVPKRR